MKWKFVFERDFVANLTDRNLRLLVTRVRDEQHLNRQLTVTKVKADHTWIEGFSMGWLTDGIPVHGIVEINYFLMIWMIYFQYNSTQKLEILDGTLENNSSYYHILLIQLSIFRNNFECGQLLLGAPINWTELLLDNSIENVSLERMLCVHSST